MTEPQSKVIITSRNAPHYIALDEDHVSDWRWTRDIGKAYRFANKQSAESFAAAFLNGMLKDVWYLGHLW